MKTQFFDDFILLLLKIHCNYSNKKRNEKVYAYRYKAYRMTQGCVSFLHKMFLTEHTPNHTSYRRYHKLELQYSHLPFCRFLCRSNAAATFHEEQIFGMILQIYMIHFHTSPSENQSVDELLEVIYFCNNI